MIKQTKVTLIAILILLASDALSAWLTSIGRLPNAVCVVASIAVLFWVTYRVVRYVNIWGAISFGALIGLVDTTLGWKVSNWVGGDPERLYTNVTFDRWFTYTFWAVVICVIISLVSFLVATYLNKGQES